MLKFFNTVRATALQFIAIGHCPLFISAARRAVGRLRSTEIVEQAERRQLLIDVSIIATHDAGTGIQRVVRSILLALFEAPPADLEVRLVRATRRRTYVYANNYTTALTGKPLPPESAVVVSSGDIFLGLDLSSRIAPRRQRDFLRWKRQGVLCAFVVYDLLPALHPQWFTARASRSFRQWLATIAIHADALFCISQAVAVDVETHMACRFGIHRKQLPTGWFHLGADSMPQTKHDVRAMRRGPAQSEADKELVILMVGTVEPRKGYAQMLDAFELLWLGGCTAKLMIVGRRGWHVDDLASRLLQHAEAGTRLHWISEADDADLQTLYLAADGLVMGSEAEGFGLPLVEAARHGIPLFARDLAVFREVAGHYATYFHANSGEQLAPQLQQWLDALADGAAIASDEIVPLTWQASAAKLTSLITPLSAATPSR